MVDIELYQRFWSRWTEVLSSEKKRQNVTFVVDTSEVRGFLVEAQASLTWPSLALKAKLSFPLTQIGNSTTRDLYLENPSSDPVVVQLVPLSTYPNPEAAVNALLESGVETLNRESAFSRSRVFALQEPVCTKSQLANKLLGVTPHPDTFVIHMEPGGKARVPVRFIPFNEQQQVSLLLIRNNLTVLEAVVLQGTGAHGQLRLGGRDTNVSHPLQFKLTEKHLQSCDSSRQSQYTLPNFTVRRVFTIYNTGLLPVYVSDFDINGSPCEGYGFRILYCYGFLLAANASRKIDIAFTPDFTLSRVQRVLNIHTSLGSGDGILNYSLVATVPPHLLARCASMVPRPHWEATVYYLVVSLMIVLLFCVVVAAYLESDRIIRRTFLAMTVTAIPAGEYPGGGGPDYGKVFDLKSIAAKASCRGGGRQPSPSGAPAGHTDAAARQRRHQPGSACPGSGSAFHNNNNNNCTSSNINLLKPQNLRTLLNSHNGSAAKEKDSRELAKGGSKRKSRKKSLSFDSSSLVVGGEKGGQQPARNGDEPPAPPPGQPACKTPKGGKRYPSNANNGPHAPPNNSSSCNGNPESDKPCSNNIEATRMWIKNDIQGSGCGSKSEAADPEAATHKKNQKKAPPVPAYHLAEEETSSTTTESSNPDVDSSEREQVKNDPKCNKLKVKYSKSGSGSRTGTDSSKVDEADDEGEFEVNFKSRSRKTREHHKGKHTDFLPSALELPYKPKPTGNRINAAKDTCCHREGTHGKSRQPKKASTFKIRALHKSINDAESSSTGKDSPPPEWDHPKPTSNTDDAYNELANQTESFALKLGQSPFQCQEKSSGGGRKFKLNEKSFLDTHPGEAGRTPRAKILPVGKIAPEPKRIQPKLYGPVGQKPPSFKSLQLPAPSCNPISAAGFTSPILGTPSTPDNPVPYYLPPILDCDQTPGNLPLPAPMFGGNPFFDGSSWRAQLDNQPNLLDDNCRQMQYDGNNWFNFASGVPLPESLWERGWAGVNDSIENNPEAEDLWDAHKLGRSSLPWPSISPWTAANANPLTGNPNMNLNDPASRYGKDQNDEKAFTAPGYDPFSTMPNIWTPPGSGQTGNESSNAHDSWSNSFFSPAPAPINKDNN